MFRSLLTFIVRFVADLFRCYVLSGHNILILQIVIKLIKFTVKPWHQGFHEIPNHFKGFYVITHSVIAFINSLIVCSWVSRAWFGRLSNLCNRWRCNHLKYSGMHSPELVRVLMKFPSHLFTNVPKFQNKSSDFTKSLTESVVHWKWWYSDVSKRWVIDFTKFRANLSWILLNPYPDLCSDANSWNFWLKKGLRISCNPWLPSFAATD